MENETDSIESYTTVSEIGDTILEKELMFEKRINWRKQEYHIASLHMVIEGSAIVENGNDMKAKLKILTEIRSYLNKKIDGYMCDVISNDLSLDNRQSLMNENGDLWT